MVGNQENSNKYLKIMTFSQFDIKYFSHYVPKNSSKIIIIGMILINNTCK